MRLRLPSYIVLETREMARIDEPVMYPYSQDVLHVGIGSLAELEKWRLIDASWHIVELYRKLIHIRLIFA